MAVIDASQVNWKSALTEDSAKVTNHMANERTYLAWVRTGITVIALGFVVAKFQLLINELFPSAPTSSIHLSLVIGVILVAMGGLLQVLALTRFKKNQAMIRAGRYEPTSAIETAVSSATFIVAILLIVYLLVTV
jgi:putative membrane protein